MFAIALFLTVTLISPLSTTRADELPSIPVTPASTKVLILPSLDETGDRADMQQEHVLVATMFFSRCNQYHRRFRLVTTKFLLDPGFSSNIPEAAGHRRGCVSNSRTRGINGACADTMTSQVSPKTISLWVSPSDTSVRRATSPKSAPPWMRELLQMPTE
jgi:hypothetical protein